VLRKNKFDYSDAEFFGLQNEIEERYSFTSIAGLPHKKPSTSTVFLRMNSIGCVYLRVGRQISSPSAGIEIDRTREHQYSDFVGMNLVYSDSASGGYGWSKASHA
jgi:hypothetical protein